MRIVALWPEPQQHREHGQAGSPRDESGYEVHGQNDHIFVKITTKNLETVWRCFKKLEIEIPYDPAIPLLGIYLKETKSLS